MLLAASAKAEGVALLGALKSLGVESALGLLLWLESLNWFEFILKLIWLAPPPPPKLEWFTFSLKENYCLIK